MPDDVMLYSTRFGRDNSRTTQQRAPGSQPKSNSITVQNNCMAMVYAFASQDSGKQNSCAKSIASFPGPRTTFDCKRQREQGCKKRNTRPVFLGCGWGLQWELASFNWTNYLRTDRFTGLITTLKYSADIFT